MRQTGVSNMAPVLYDPLLPSAPCLMDWTGIPKFKSLGRHEM
jgi:hypothetical protein